MGLGAPWVRSPDWWSLDGTPIRVHVPETTSLVMALSLPDDRGAGLWTTLALTDELDQWKVVSAVIDAGPAIDRILDDVADLLVEKITGWKRWEAAHVWQQTLGAWSIIDGDLTAQGVNITSLSITRATNTAFSWWRRNLGRDEQAWKKWLRDMEREPRRIIEREADVPMDAAVFGDLADMMPKQATVVPTSTIQMP